MARQLVDPPFLVPGDRVAVVSPSFAAPAHFPEIHEQAMQRLRDELALVPVEYPSTRHDSTPAERAADLMAAFADPEIAAVMATIGGDDQVTVLPHLDPAVIRATPKRFLGYSDNTNLLNYLWHQGISAIHGGSTQVHLGPTPDDLHLRSLHAALFGGDVVLTEPERTRDFGISWDNPRSLTERAPDLPAESWTWSGPERAVTGRTWGGCIDVLPWVLGVGVQMHPAEAYEGSVLILEPSEELIPPRVVYHNLRVLGERGILAAADALLWGRPVAGDFERPADADTAKSWRARHRESVLRAVAEYSPDLVVTLDVDFGHTCPQWLLPYGGRVTVDGAQRRITAHFEESPRA